MQAVLERQTTIDISAIYAMRHSGATLGQIAERIGRTKERIRQILIKDYGSTRHRLVSTRQLCKLAGLAPYRLAKLCRDSIISPVREWDTNNGHYCLWSPATVEKIKVYSKLSNAVRLCRICHRPVLGNRHRYCSEQCYKESHKYKYRSFEAKERHRISMKRYQRARRQLAKAGSVGK